MKQTFSIFFFVKKQQIKLHNFHDFSFLSKIVKLNINKISRFYFCQKIVKLKISRFIFQKIVTLKISRFIFSKNRPIKKKNFPDFLVKYRQIEQIFFFFFLNFRNVMWPIILTKWQVWKTWIF